MVSLMTVTSSSPTSAMSGRAEVTQILGYHLPPHREDLLTMLRYSLMPLAKAIGPQSYHHAGQMSFLLRAGTDTFPTPLNLRCYRLRTSPSCPLCGQTQPAIYHILSNWSEILQQGRYILGGPAGFSLSDLVGVFHIRDFQYLGLDS